MPGTRIGENLEGGYHETKTILSYSDFLLLLGFVSSAQPVFFMHVRPGTCYVDDTADGEDTGLDWTNAYVDLQSSLNDEGCTWDRGR